jgi:hypothetical protein
MKEPLWFMIYAVYLYFCSLSLRKASNALIVAIWLWIQKFANLTNRFKVDKVSCIFNQ